MRVAQRTWLEQVMKETGKSLSRIADEAGRPGTTLTRFYNDANYSGVLSGIIVQAISEATGIAGPGAVLSAPAKVSNLREDGVPFEANGSAPLTAAVAAIVGDNPNLSAWRLGSDVLRLAGVSNGDVLIVDMAAEPRDGDIVCAQIEHGFGAMTVFRVLQRPALVGAALDLASVRPEIVDGQRVRIAGVMTQLLRSRS